MTERPAEPFLVAGYSHVKLEEFAQYSNATPEEVERVVFGAIWEFMNKFRSSFTGCIVDITETSEFMQAAFGTTEVRRDEDLQDEITEFELQLAQEGWPQVMTVSYPFSPSREGLAGFAQSAMEFGSKM